MAVQLAVAFGEKGIHMDGADPEVLHDDDAQHLKA